MTTKLSASTPWRHQVMVELLRAGDTVWNISRLFFARWDLGPSQFNVLNLLRDNPVGLSQTELSRELVMHRSNLTGLVDRLEKRGLVERREASADRRAYRVVLTPAGTRLLGEILPRYLEGVEHAGAHLAKSRAEALISDLRRLAQNAERFAAEMAEEPQPQEGHEPQSTAERE